MPATPCLDLLLHPALREELGTLKGNLRLLTAEIQDRIDQEVVNAGRCPGKKSPEDAINARCDSFVVETDVHFPTDNNLLFDAIRKKAVDDGHDYMVVTEAVIQTGGLYPIPLPISLVAAFTGRRRQV